MIKIRLVSGNHCRWRNCSFYYNWSLVTVYTLCSNKLLWSMQSVYTERAFVSVATCYRVFCIFLWFLPFRSEAGKQKPEEKWKKLFQEIRHMVIMLLFQCERSFTYANDVQLSGENSNRQIVVSYFGFFRSTYPGHWNVNNLVKRWRGREWLSSIYPTVWCLRRWQVHKWQMLGARSIISNRCIVVRRLSVTVGLNYNVIFIWLYKKY